MQDALTRTLSFVRKNRAYFLSFFLPALILFVSYIFFHVYPFGTRSVLSLDLNAQYVYYYDYMYDVLAGKESLFYSWSRNLSGEFMGIIGYYLASPFNWLVWMFPRTMITEGLMTMMLAKAGASGLAMAFLLKKHRGYSNATSVMFSVMFALCGFFVVQTMNPMWLDGIVALPLVVMGVERICDKRRFKLYVLSLVYIFVANFYIGYMIGIFSALYFLYYMASGKSKNKCFGEVCGATLMYGLSSVSAILMSAFMILPVYKSLSNGKLSFTDPDYTPVENFNLADIFIKLFPATYDTVRMEGLPILYVGTLALVFAAVYFAAKSFPARERIAGAALVGIMVLCMWVRPVDMLWHGGQMPNWLPYRYSFVISFLLMLFGAQAFEHIRVIRSKVLGLTFVLLLGIILFCDLNGGHDYYDTNLIMLIPLGVLAIICIMAYVFKRYADHPAMRATMTAAVCLEMLLNTVLTLYDMHDDIVFSDRSTYLGDIPYSRKITDEIHEQDDGFYRMEKTYHRCVNDPIALRMYGLSHSSSTLNSKSIDFLKSLGISAREHYTRSDGSTVLTDDILGVKYVLSKYACYVPYNQTLDIDNEINVTVYENPDALGIAYLADSDVIGFSYNEYSPFIAQNKAAAMISGNKALTIFRPADNYSLSHGNVTVGTTTDGHHSYHVKDDDDEAWIQFDIIMPDDGYLYMYLPTSYERETYLYVDDQYRSNYFKYENYGSEYIGYYFEGDTVSIKLKLLEDSLYMKDPQFYYANEDSLDLFHERMDLLNAETVLTRTGGAELTLEVDAPEDCALFTSIPLEEGWTAYVDGEEVPLFGAFDNALMCIEVEQGRHTIKLSFFPAGLRTGIILTISGALLFAIMILAAMRMRRNEAAYAALAYDESSDAQTEAEACTPPHFSKSDEPAPPDSKDSEKT